MGDVARVKPGDFKTSVLGRGVSRPFRVDLATGRIAMSVAEDHVKEAIRAIVMYSKGDYPLYWGFGSGLRDDVFGVVSASIVSEVAFKVKIAIDRYEPRVKNVYVVVGEAIKEKKTDLTQIVIRIWYTLVATNEVNNLVLLWDREQGTFKQASSYEE